MAQRRQAIEYLRDGHFTGCWQGRLMDGWGGRLNSLGGYTSNYLMKISSAGHQKERERERELWWLLGQMARQDPKKDLLLGGSIKVDKPKNETGLDTANSRQVNSNCMRDLQATMSAMDIIEWAQASISHNEERKHLVYYNKVVVLSAFVCMCYRKNKTFPPSVAFRLHSHRLHHPLGRYVCLLSSTKIPELL